MVILVPHQPNKEEMLIIKPLEWLIIFWTLGPIYFEQVSHLVSVYHIPLEYRWLDEDE